MLIIGAKGFAKEVLEVFHQQNQLEGLAFYDDVSIAAPQLLFDRFRVIKSLSQAKEEFLEDPRFVLGIGGPKLRRNMAEKMASIGGSLVSAISLRASIGGFNNIIGIGVNIMTGAVITNDVLIENGVLINLNCTIGHDVVIGEYSELSPGVHISGNVNIGKSVVIGTGAVLLPGVNVGDNSVIGAGSVVNKNIESNVVAVGIPAKVIKMIE